MPRITLLFSLIVIILAGCVALTDPEGKDAGPYPDNWRELVREYIKTNYVDPYSIRDSQIAPPFRSRKAFFDEWIVCLRNNAKNQFGGYTGLRTTDISIRQGRVNIGSIDETGFHCRRQNLDFEPLPIN